MNNNSTPGIISTAFPYAYAVPHLGNITQAIKGDLYSKIRSTLHKYSYISSPTVFCYSFHATGLPVYFRIKEIKTILKACTIDNHLNLKNFKIKLVQYYKDKNILPLLKYVKKVKDCTTLKGWVKTMAAYYTKLFSELHINSNLPLYHTTTDIDKGYSRFVSNLYENLYQKGLLIEDENYLIYCTNCGIVLGDHDRIKEEGIGITYHSVNKKITSEGAWYYIQDNPLNWVKIQDTVYISEKLNLKIHVGVPSNSKVIFYDDTKNILVDSTSSFFKDLSSIQPTSTNIYTTSAGIICRCGGSSKIGKEKTMFIKFTDPLWKEMGERSIQEALISNQSRKVLLKALSKLRNVAFLRSFGYGTKLSFLPQPYNKKVVDSLMDSALHPFYYSYFLDSKSESDLNHVSKYNYLAHMTGKDLLPSHLLYMHLFSCLLYPNIKVPYFETTRFICASNNEKMSKSLSNVVYWSDLKKFCSPTGLKGYIANLADTDQATPFSKERLIESQKNIIKHRRIILQYLQEGRINFQSIDPINKIINKIALSIGQGTQFRLRQVYHLIHHKLRIILAESNPGCHTYELEKRLIKDLLSCFD